MMIRFCFTVFTVVMWTSAFAANFTPTEPKQIEFVVRDRDGVVHAESEFRAPLTLLHFWATWCLPCREELPALAKLQSDLGKDGVRVVAVSVDRLGWGAVDRTTEQLGVGELEIFHDLNRETAIALGADALPMTIVIDGRGREVARLRGQGDWASEEIRRELLSFATAEDQVGLRAE